MNILMVMMKKMIETLIVTKEMVIMMKILIVNMAR